MTVTIDKRRELRRRPFWRVADFAAYTGFSHWQAKAILQRYDAELNGLLLRRSKGNNRLFVFAWRSLAKHDAGAFLDDPLETQSRVDALEDHVGDLDSRSRILGAQTGQNTRDINRMRERRVSAA